MPTEDEHVSQAEHNRAFWDGLGPATTVFRDWVVVGIFYEAVHWIEAFLGTKGEHAAVHANRLTAIRRHRTDIGTLQSDYEVLKQESENARYRCHTHTSAEISGDLVPLVEGIKSHIRSILFPASPPGP